MQYLTRQLSLSHGIFILLAALGLIYPQEFNEALGGWTAFFSTHFDWLVMLTCTGFVIFSLVLAFSRYGRIRLGGQNETPEYDTLSWFSMLFAAGMGTGLVFHGAAEPLFHLGSPPPSVLGEDISQARAARQAMLVTYLHWGIHAWAIYALAALAVAYFTFRQQQPMLVSAPMQKRYGLSNRHVVSKALNTLAVLAAVFGLVASIGTGIHQTQSGLERYGWMQGDSNAEMLIILAALTFCYIASSLTGLGKGIRWLSNINMIACILLMLFVLFVGPTHFILQGFVITLGEYLSRFLALGMNARAYVGGTEWVQEWTISYFMWWIAWAPFVAVFIARISRGRTIRQFVLGVILAPTLFSTFWFSVLGGASIYQDMVEGANLAEVATNDLSDAMFELLALLPWEPLTSGITLFLIFIFLVTSADSGAYVLAMFTSEGNPRPPRFQRLFWGAMVAGLTGIVLVSGQGLLFLRSISLAGAMPYMVIMIVQCYLLWRYVEKDVQRLDQSFVELEDEEPR